jgi:hypothetical protein
MPSRQPILQRLVQAEGRHSTSPLASQNLEHLIRECLLLTILREWLGAINHSPKQMLTGRGDGLLAVMVYV